MRSPTLRRSALAAALSAGLLTVGAAKANIDGGFPLIDSPENAQRYGAVGMDLTGNQLVVWNEAGADAIRILARRFRPMSDDGGPIEVLASYPTTDSVDAPALAMLPYDGAVVVWHADGNTPGSSRIVAQRVFDDGIADGESFVVAEEAHTSHAFPAVAMSRNGYHWATAWRASDSDGRDDVMVRPYVLDSALAPAFAVNEGDREVFGLPQVAMGYDDEYVVVWIETSESGAPSRTIMARRFHPWGGPLGEPVALHSTGQEIQHVRVAQIGENDLVVAWHTPVGAIELRRYSPDLLIQQARVVQHAFPGTPLGPPSLAVDRQGEVTLAYDAQDPDAPHLRRVHVVNFDADLTQQSGTAIYGSEWNDEYTGGLAVDADGDALVLRRRVDPFVALERLEATRVLQAGPIDVEIRVATPEYANRAGYVDYEVSVSNRNFYGEEGVDFTTGFAVEFNLPPQLTIIDRFHENWRCGPLQDHRLACTYEGTLTPYASSASIHVAATTPDASVDLTGTASVIPRHEDAIAGNDSVEFVTRVRDLVPDAFTFVDRTGVPRGSEQTSDEVIITGLDGQVGVWLSEGGEISVNGAPWTSDTTVTGGDRVRVRHLAATGFGASVHTVLYVSEVHDTFTTTTEARDITPDAFAFVDQSDVQTGIPVTSAPITVTGINDTVPVGVSGGTYSLNGGAFTAAAGTARAGDTLRVQHTAALSPATATNTVLTAGGVSDTFTSTTVPADTTPEPFAFAAQNDVARNSQQTSVPVQISGINSAAPISVTGGSYSIDGAAFTSAAGTIVNGQFVRVRHAASAAFSTATTTQLTIGGVQGGFTSTTLARDVTPDPFAFAAQTGVPRGSVRTSAEVTIAGINDAAPLSVSGGSYSIDGGAFTSAPGTIDAGQRLRLQHTAAGGFGATTTTTVSVGTASAGFSSTTEAQDTVPDAFAFVDRTGLATSVEAISDAVTLGGINAATPISVTGGSYSVNGGAFTTAAGTVVAGDQVRVRHVSASSANTAVTTTLTVGGVSDAFSSTTGATDSTPNAFAFADLTGVQRNKVATSAPVTVAGINTAVPVSVSGGGARWSKNGGAYTTAAGTVVAGDVVRLQVTMPNSRNFTVNVQVGIGGVADTWSVTTAP